MEISPSELDLANFSHHLYGDLSLHRSHDIHAGSILARNLIFQAGADHEMGTRKDPVCLSVEYYCVLITSLYYTYQAKRCTISLSYSIYKHKHNT